MTFGKKKHGAGDPAADKNQSTPDTPPSASPADAGVEATAPSPDSQPSAESHDAAPAAAECAPAPAPSEADVLRDRLLRLQADFDNYRKRMARERQETILRANEDLLEALLTPVDHMDRALEVMAGSVKDDDPCLQGVRMVRTELRNVLDRFGLKAVETQGRPFDPALHEALGLVPSSGVAEGHVAAEVRAGYLLNGRLLRAAQVMVAGSPANDAPEAPKSNAEG